MDESCWDDVAIRDIIAIVLFALHLRDGGPVEQVKWESVPWHLRDDQSVRALVEESLPSADHQLRPAPEREADTDRDPVEERWRWLTRTWDPQAPIHTRTLDPSSPWYRPPTPGPDGTVPELRWGGMTRGIGDGLPDPALVRNSSGVSRLSLSHQSGDPGLGCRRRTAPAGVSEIAGKRYSFETQGLAA